MKLSGYGRDEHDADDYSAGENAVPQLCDPLSTDAFGRVALGKWIVAAYVERRPEVSV